MDQDQGGGIRARPGGRPSNPRLPHPAPCHPPTGCCHTGWAAGRPRAARTRSTGPAARPRGPGLQRAGPPPQLCCWSRGLPQPQCCWRPRQGHWLRAQEPGLRRRPEAAAGQGLRGRPRPAGPSGHPAGPPGAPAAAVGVAVAVGRQSHWGHPGPAEGKWGEWADAGPGAGAGSGGCSAGQAEVSVEWGGHPQETQEASRGAARGSRSTNQGREDRLDRRPRAGDPRAARQSPGPGTPEEPQHTPSPRCQICRPAGGQASPAGRSWLHPVGSGARQPAPRSGEHGLQPALCRLRPGIPAVLSVDPGAQ